EDETNSSPGSVTTELRLPLTAARGDTAARAGDCGGTQPSASASASLPDVSPKLVDRHRFTRAPATLATHHESELGRQLARRRVVTLLNVGRNAFGVGPIPEVADRGVRG